MTVVRRIRNDGRPAYKWGRSGLPFHYDAGDIDSRAKAYTNAKRQGDLILLHRRRDGLSEDPRVDKYKRLLTVKVKHERAYHRVIRDDLARAKAIIMAHLKRAVGSRKLDAKSAPPVVVKQDALAAINSARGAIGFHWGPTRTQIEAIGEAVARDSTKAITSYVNDGAPKERAAHNVRAIEAHGPTQVELLKDWASRQETYIKSIPAASLDRMASIVEEHATEGLDVRGFAEIIKKSFDVSDARADFLARDQVSKYNGAIRQSASKSLGLERYTWVTMHDGAVRPMHAALDGTEQAYSDPPITNDDGEANNPSEDYGCRCLDMPILPDYDEAELDAELANALS